MASSDAPADVSSLFSKKKGKKGKKGPKAYNLNLDSGITKPEETPKITAMNEILGGSKQSEDDGWADVVEKKSVVATGGKQVSELIDMTSLMTEEESTASKLEKQDIKQAFHDARMLKEHPEPPKEESKGEAKADEGSKSKGLSGNIFGGGDLRQGWQARLHERELKQREQELSVDNATAFPSLKDAMSGPVKPKPSSSAPEGNAWVRRGGGSAAVAAIKAALGKGGDGDAAPKPEAKAANPPSQKPKAAEPVWVTPRMVARPSGSESAVATTAVTEKQENVEPIPKAAERPAGGGPKINGEHVAGGDRTADVEGKTETSRQGNEVSAAVESAASAGGEKGGDATKVEPEKAAKLTEAKPEGSERTAVAEAENPDKPAAAEPAEPVPADKNALVQQFGKKKKKKKKATAED